MDLLAHLLPVPDDAAYVAALEETQRYLRSFGVTGWQDAIVGAYAGMRDTSDAYIEAIESGRLTAHATGALWLTRGFGLEDVDEVVEDLVGRRDRIGTRSNAAGGSFRAPTIKIMQDGVPESQTAAMKKPYLDACGHPTSHLGPSHFPPEVLDADRSTPRRRGLPAAHPRDRRPRDR